jgi:iron complex outermembrane receptor protein
MKCYSSNSFTSLINTISLAIATATFSAAITAQERQLEEVIVTAQKRAESSQDIALAVSAFGSDMMESAGITQTHDLTKLSPSLSAGQSSDKNNGGFRIRGVGTSVFSVGVEQSVAVIVDDVSTLLPGQATANLIDIERVEILRGPQSTLFGKSASAGVISIITKSPAEELEGSIEFTLTDEEEQKVVASVSGPINDSLGYRLSGHWSDREEFAENLLPNGDDANGEKSKGLRGKLQWNLNDTAEVLLTAYYSEDESTCCAQTWAVLDPVARILGFIPGDPAPGITPSDDNMDFIADDLLRGETETSGVNARITVALGEYTFMSITSQDSWEYINTLDLDFSGLDVLGILTGAAVNGGLVQGGSNETDFFSQEFRLSSPSYEHFDYLVGLYYADGEVDREFLRNDAGLPLASNWAGNSNTESLALFGQANWRFSDATTLTVGLRYNDEEISVDFVEKFNDPTNTISGDESDTEVLGDVSVQHFFRDDIMVYARYAQGYKGQAFDLTATFNEDKAMNPVAPETSDAYEIGIKSELLDNRLQLNLTAFYTEYEDFQAQSTTIDPVTTAITTDLNNVGALETQGVELEGIALIGDNLTLTFGAAYVDATIENFEGATCYAGQTEATGCVGEAQDISGGELPNSPEWKWNVVADYRMDFDGLPFSGFANLSYVWQDDINFSLLQNPVTAHDSYGVGDLNLGINDDNGRYRITLFVNNFTDENYRSGLVDYRGLYGGAIALANSFSRNSQRYYGVRAKFSF